MSINAQSTFRVVGSLEVVFGFVLLAASGLLLYQGSRATDAGFGNWPFFWMACIVFPAGLALAIAGIQTFLLRESGRKLSIVCGWVILIPALCYLLPALPYVFVRPDAAVFPLILTATCLYIVFQFPKL